MVQNPDYQHAPAVAAETEPQFDLRRYLGVVFKYKGAIVAMALLVALIGFYVAAKAVPVYASTTVLQIERQGAGGDFAEQLMGFYRNQQFYATQYELIRSWGVAEIAAGKLGLLDNLPEGGEAAQPPGGFSWRGLLSRMLNAEPKPLTAEQIRSSRIAGVQGGTQVVPVENSQLVGITMHHIDPEEAARRANVVAEAYVEFLKDKNLENIQIDQVWYASRLETARAELDLANQDLQDYYERQDLFRSGAAEGGATLQESRLQTALQNQQSAREQRSRLERLVRDITNARQGTGTLQDIAELESRGVVRTLKAQVIEARQAVNRLSQRYGPRHPRMIEANAQLGDAEASYQRELEDVAGTVVADYRRAQSAEQTYGAEVNQAKGEIRSLDRNLAEQQKLQDRVETARAIFEKLQSGEATIGMLQSGSQKPVVTIVEYARPNFSPVRPNKLRMVAVAGFVGLLLGLGLAFLLDHLDNTFKGAREVEERLSLPLLGSLPKLKVSKGGDLSPMREFSRSRKSAFSESVRTIRTGAMLAGLDRNSNVIMVTSSLPGEGKTTLSMNLAYALGHMKSTILIDADMRRPMVGKAHDRARSQPGLSSFVTHESTFEESVTRSEDSDLTVMHAGSVPPNPLELLGSARFIQVLKDMRERYEYIVLDCAPALAVSDALVLSRLADAVLYVIKSDSTPHQAASEGVQRLRRVDAPLLGVVLNQVSSRGRGYYYYGRYHRYGYSRYGYYDQYQYSGYYGDAKDES